MYQDIMRQLMEEKPLWNQLGPHLPLWFTERIKDVDPQLRLQFFPPRRLVGKYGVGDETYPFGVWVVCRRLRRTGWLLLHAQWVYQLSQVRADGRYYHRPPVIQDIYILEAAYRLWRQGRSGEITEMLDASMKGLCNARAQESKDAMRKRIGAMARRLNMTTFGGRRIVVPRRVA